MANTISGVIAVQVLKDGDTISGQLLSTRTLSQLRDKNSGAFSPDYSAAEGYAIIFPEIQSAIKGGTIFGVDNITEVVWKFNGTDVSSMSDVFETTTQGEADTQVPALKMKGNPVDEVGSYKIDFEAKVNNGTSTAKINLFTTFTLEEIAGSGYSVTLEATNGGVVTQIANETLKPYVRLGATEVQSGVFFKYYKLVGETWQDFGSNATSRASVTVTPDDVNGEDLFKVAVHSGTADGAVLAEDTQSVIDRTDPYQILLVIPTLTKGMSIVATPQVTDGTTIQEGWTITLISLRKPDGTEIKQSTSGSLNINYEEVKDVDGEPFLYITAEK